MRIDRLRHAPSVPKGTQTKTQPAGRSATNLVGGSAAHRLIQSWFPPAAVQCRSLYLQSETEFLSYNRQTSASHLDGTTPSQADRLTAEIDGPADWFAVRDSPMGQSRDFSPDTLPFRILGQKSQALDYRTVDLREFNNLFERFSSAKPGGSHRTRNRPDLLRTDAAIR